MKINVLKRFAPALALGATLLATAGAAQASGQIRWSGSVDDTVVVYVHGRDVRTETVSGKSASDVSTDIAGRIGRRPLSVSLRQGNGRGRIRLIQQPSASNDYTAAIRIRDSQPGRDHYSFVLDWQSDEGPNGDGPNGRDRVFRGGNGSGYGH